MKKTLPIFLVILLIAAVVINKRFLVDMENETVEEICPYGFYGLDVYDFTIFYYFVLEIDDRKN